MRRLLGVAFAAILGAEIVLLAICAGLLWLLCAALWERSPWRAVLLGAVVIGGLVAAKWSDRGAATSSDESTHRGINLSAIPVSGTGGVLFMVQFLLWAVLSPAVGIFFAVLLGLGLVLAPLLYYWNQRNRGHLARVGAGSFLGVLCGLALVAYGSFRATPAAVVFVVALCLGVVMAPLLIWRRSTSRRISIAPYGD